MIALVGVGLLPLAIWLYLVGAHGAFWLARERDDRDAPGEPPVWPAVTAVIPARDEADVVARSLGSVLAQDYPGPFRVILVDDNSTDGTADIARALSSGRDRLTVLDGAPLLNGWTGKLWAVNQGVALAEADRPKYLWLTDADIAHAPDTLRTLIARAEAGDFALVSLMAKLHCTTFAERALIPAFVFFFQMVYPFGKVNRPGKTAGAAGGCMLARREALGAAGGIAAIRTALIDDCSLGALMKSQGPIWLGLTNRSVSLRPYETVGEIGRMVSRSAYAQLDYSIVKLAGVVIGMSLVYAAPPLALLLGGPSLRVAGGLTYFLMALSFQPMLRFYRLSPAWGLALPIIGTVYGLFTLQSAVQTWRGRGGLWKGRVQAMS